MKYIELFSGCGGLSLGLETVGFNLVMANEISPMASQTYAYNLLNTDLEQTLSNIRKVKWLSSNYSVNSIEKRLREDPRTAPKLGEGFTDLSLSSLENNQLIVGDLTQLNLFLDKNPDYVEQLRTALGQCNELDLVSGGPPCQSFSLAGLRQLNNHRNILPWEFAKFVAKVKPKIVLLENVSGILMPFEDEENNKHYAWYEVAKAFAKINYIPLCLHINAKYAGAAQNRPRFILIAIKENFYCRIKSSLNELESSMFKKPLSFFNELSIKDDVEYGLLDVIDIEQNEYNSYFKNTFLESLASNLNAVYSVKDAIDDLKKQPTSKTSNYVTHINNIFKKPEKTTGYELKNHEFRSNGSHVQQRFRIYQVLSLVSSSTQKEVKSIIGKKTSFLSEHAANELMKYHFLYNECARYFFTDKEKLQYFLMSHSTKKQTQKALVANQPAPAALSIPDDVCHYDEHEVRTLTVREMARIQSFPDWFTFKSKVTTGGKSRQFEVPQYTQVGNAVPPLLGLALGKTVRKLLSFSSKSDE